MKQVLVPKYFFNSGKTNQFSTDTTHVNPIGFVSLDALDTFLAAAPTKDFAIMYRAGTTQAPMAIEVDYNSLNIVKSEPNSINLKTYSVVLTGGEACKNYTINLVRRGSIPHERNMYRINVYAKSDMSADDLGAAIVAQYNRVKDSFNIEEGITVAYNTSNDTLTVTANPIHCEVQFIDALSSLTVTTGNGSSKVITLTKEELERRISECIAGRGVQHRHEFGPTIYPFIEQIDPSKTYVIYTMRFAVPRKASKTRDEVASQLVHFIVDSTLTTIKTFIEAIKAPANP